MNLVRDSSGFHRELHRLRNAFNLMVNSQRCLRSPTLDDAERARLTAAFERGCAEATRAMADLESLGHADSPPSPPDAPYRATDIGDAP